LAQRARLGFFTDEQGPDAAYADRASARKFLLETLVSRGFLGMDEAAQLEQAQDPAEESLFRLVVAAYRLLGHSASRLLLVQLEDALLQRDQINTPGTFDEVPNWRRRLPEAVESFGSDERLAGLARIVGEARSPGNQA
jgi:4-alpha-glucanotransferase